MRKTILAIVVITISVAGLPCGRTGLCSDITPANPVPPYTLVRVHLAEGERAWVIGADLSPVDVAQTAGGLVWTGPPGRYAVLSWSALDQQQHMVVIGGTTPTPPTPNPPTPDPNPPTPPGPTPDVPPTDLLVKYGLGLESWRSAVSVGRPEAARTLASAYLLAATNLHQSRCTVSQALASVRDARSKLAGDWTPWDSAVEAALQRAVDTHGSTTAHWRNYLYEIGKSLEIASRVSIIRQPQPANCTTGRCPQ